MEQIATLMKGESIGNDVYIFHFDRVIEGEYDEKTKIFKENKETGAFFSMTSKNAISKGSNPYVAYHMMNFEDAKRKYCKNEKNPNHDMVIKRFEEDLVKRAYIVGSSASGKVFSKVLNLAEMSQERINKKEMVDAKVPLDELEQLLLDATIEGKNTKEEIEYKRDALILANEAIENAIGTMDLVLNAMEVKKPFVEYLNEEIEKANKIDKAKEDGKDVHTRAIGDEESNNNKKEDTSNIVKKDKKPSEQRKMLPATVPKVEKKERIDIDKVYKEVTKTIIAQDEPVRRIITEIARKEMDNRLKAEGILITGPTGVGKTETMRQIALHLGRSFFKMTATDLTMPAYTGTDIEEEMHRLIKECGSVAKAEEAVTYVDEIDKKGSKDNSDVSGRGVLNLFLPFIEGKTYEAAEDTRTSTKRTTIDTTNMIKIFSGAFTEVYNNLKEKGMGFDKDPYPKYREATPEDFVKYGEMTNEFMGRLLVVKLNDLFPKDLREVLLKSDQSSLRVQEAIFRKLGIDIIFTDEYINNVAEKAYNKKTGARGLKGIVSDTTWRAFDEIYADPYKYQKVIMTGETVDNNRAYQLIKK